MRRRARAPDGGRWMVRVVFESMLIVVSIVVALGVNEWRDRRELQAQARDARIAFAREINANRDLLLGEESGLPHHRRVWQRYREVGAKSVVTAADLQPIYDEFPHGINPLRPRDAVWRSLSGGDVLRRFDQRVLFLLAEIIGNRKRSMITTARCTRPGARLTATRIVPAT